jgi:RING finger protein 113A
MEPDAPVAVFKKRGAKGRSNIRKRPATPPPASKSDSDSDGDYSSSEDESGRRVKRRKKTTVINATSSLNKADDKDLTASAYTADRTAAITNANDATKQSNWYDEDAKDALSAKNLLGSSKAAPKDTQASDGLYKGLANQTSFIQKNPDAPNRTVGPVKAPTNIRTITVTDFAPDVCKDYKQTGFCGFGDNCKFLHDRSVVQQGWQIDREWEKVHKGKTNLGGTVVASADRTKNDAANGEDEEEKMLEKIPFACIICKQSYREPIVTKCGHYFCEPCALKRYRKDPTCAACGAGTMGVFNSAKRLKKLLDRKREREAKRRQEALENGEKLSDEEGDA